MASWEQYFLEGLDRGNRFANDYQTRLAQQHQLEAAKRADQRQQAIEAGIDRISNTDYTTPAREVTVPAAAVQTSPTPQNVPQDGPGTYATQVAGGRVAVPAREDRARRMGDEAKVLRMSGRFKEADEREDQARDLPFKEFKAGVQAGAARYAAGDFQGAAQLLQNAYNNNMPDGLIARMQTDQNGNIGMSTYNAVDGKLIDQRIFNPKQINDMLLQLQNPLEYEKLLFENRKLAQELLTKREKNQTDREVATIGATGRTQAATISATGAVRSAGITANAARYGHDKRLEGTQYAADARVESARIRGASGSGGGDKAWDDVNKVGKVVEDLFKNEIKEAVDPRQQQALDATRQAARTYASNIVQFNAGAGDEFKPFARNHAQAATVARALAELDAAATPEARSSVMRRHNITPSRAGDVFITSPKYPGVLFVSIGGQIVPVGRQAPSQGQPGDED